MSVEAGLNQQVKSKEAIKDAISFELQRRLETHHGTGQK